MPNKLQLFFFLSKRIGKIFSNILYLPITKKYAFKTHYYLKTFISILLVVFFHSFLIKRKNRAHFWSHFWFIYLLSYSNRAVITIPTQPSIKKPNKNQTNLYVSSTYCIIYTTILIICSIRTPNHIICHHIITLKTKSIEHFLCITQSSYIIHIKTPLLDIHPIFKLTFEKY
jgi:hypothetical protein